jgi:hypothetical protein
MAIAGKTNHNPITGHTIANVTGKNFRRNVAERTAINGDIHIVRKDSISSGRLWGIPFTEEFHSRSRFFEIINLQHVRNKAFIL